MNLHELIDRSEELLSNAIIAKQRGNLREAYNQMNELDDLLTDEIAQMEVPE